MSSTSRNRVLFTLFLVSGFCGLAYQVVWMRLAYASFGIVTPVMSVVISIFMAGLALGSWVSGRYVGSWTRTTGLSAIHFYAAAEVLIGLGAFLVPPLFRMGEQWLLPVGEMGSARYLALSGVILGSSILPWCVAMGATYPLVLAFLKEVREASEESFSFLYLANVIGAMLGVLATALVLIELLGFTWTLRVAALANFSIAAAAVGLGVVHRGTATSVVAAASPHPANEPVRAFAGSGLLLAVLFTTGFCSMGMEVVWVRAFTPVIGTLVYSFAVILFTYLLATWIGSWLYRRHLNQGSVVPTAQLAACMAVAAFLPVLFNDPRVTTSWLLVIGSIFPVCGVLGYLTPKLVDEYSHGFPERAGRAYAINVIGSILGPLFGCYALLPSAGARLGLVVLALPLVAVWLAYWRSDALGTGWRVATLGGTGVLLASALFVNVSFEEGPLQIESEIRRDHTTTVVSYGAGMNKQLEVNGVGITRLTPLAKVMAHMPLGLLEHRPDSALVICFGMGTTYRSLLSWDIDATAVELSPSVVDAFPFYFDDAGGLVSDPRGRIVVDDGRRFLQRSPHRYDVVTIDPPPPIEAAGSSLLYSRDFMGLLRERIKEDGVLHHWFPGGERLSLNAVTRSIVESFPYVRTFTGYNGIGVHYIASVQPVELPTAAEFLARMPEDARSDLLEWGVGDGWSPEEFVQQILAREVDVERLLVPDPDVVVTDDRPYNEYYLLRRLFGGGAASGGGASM